MSLSDVATVLRGKDPAVVKLALREGAPRAVRHTGGFKMLCFRASDSSECLKLHAALQQVVADNAPR